MKTAMQYFQILLFIVHSSSVLSSAFTTYCIHLILFQKFLRFPFGLLLCAVVANKLNTLFVMSLQKCFFKLIKYIVNKYSSSVLS